MSLESNRRERLIRWPRAVGWNSTRSRAGNTRRQLFDNSCSSLFAAGSTGRRTTEQIRKGDQDPAAAGSRSSQAYATGVAKAKEVTETNTTEEPAGAATTAARAEQPATTARC